MIIEIKVLENVKYLQKVNVKKTGKIFQFQRFSKI